MIMDYDKLNQKSKVERKDTDILGIWIFVFVILLSIGGLTCWFFKNSVIIEKVQDTEYIEVVENEVIQGVQVHPNFEQLDVRLQDAVLARIDFTVRFMNIIDIKNNVRLQNDIPVKIRKSNIRNAIREAVSKWTTKDAYEKRPEFGKSIIEAIKKVDTGLKTIEIHEIQFPERIKIEFEKKRQAEIMVLEAKAKKERAIIEAEKAIIEHEMKMKELKMERERKIYDAETEKKIKEILK